jgi:hypothetical protein
MARQRHDAANARSAGPRGAGALSDGLSAETREAARHTDERNG